MPASVDLPIRAPLALQGHTSQRLALTRAATVKLANFQHRRLPRPVKIALQTRTHPQAAIAVNAMQAFLGPTVVARGGFLEGIRVLRVLPESTRQCLGPLRAWNVKLASLQTARLLSSAKTVVRTRILLQEARVASAKRGTRETALHALHVGRAHTRPLLDQRNVSIAQLEPTKRRRPLSTATLVQKTHNPPPAAPSAHAMQASLAAARHVPRVRQASSKQLQEQTRAATVRLANTPHRRRRWAAKIALPTRIPREAARHVFATPASRAPMDNALRARRERSRLRRDLLHAQTVGREPIRLPQLR